MGLPNPMLSATERIFILRPATADLLRRPINGRGGFQTILRRLAAGLGDTLPEGVVLIAAIPDLDKLVRLSSGGKLQRHRGGFQQRVMAVIVDSLMNTMAIPTPTAEEYRAQQIGLPFPSPANRHGFAVLRGGKS